VMGDIEIAGEGELIMEHAYCNIKGKLYIRDKGKSYAELHNCVAESFFPREIEESKISFINCKK